MIRCRIRKRDDAVGMKMPEAYPSTTANSDPSGAGRLIDRDVLLPLFALRLAGWGTLDARLEPDVSIRAFLSRRLRHHN
jgi:hypothetical protein